MKTLRLWIAGLIAIVVIGAAWKTAHPRILPDAQRTSGIQQPAAPGRLPPPAGSQQTAKSRSTAPENPAEAVPAATGAQEKETVERLGPFSISGKSYSVVLHEKHLVGSPDVAVLEADGVVAMEIVDTTGAILYQRTYPLWAESDAYSAWKIWARLLVGANGVGLLLRSTPNVDSSGGDPELDASYSQVFGIVDGKLVPFSGPFPALLAKPDAGGVYRTVEAMGPKADELQLGFGTGRFVVVVPIRIDWAQGKLSLAPKCPGGGAGGPRALCEYQLLDPNSLLQRPKDLTWVRLYSNPDENSGPPERVVVKPASTIEILACRTAYEMKQPDFLSPPPAPEFFKDAVQIGPAPNTDTWLQVRIDGKVGWIHSDEDFTALGLPEPEDTVD